MASDLVDDLYQVVRRYVENNGGVVLVVGGIQIVEWPSDNAGVFHVSVKCTGRKPDFAREPQPATSK